MRETTNLRSADTRFLRRVETSRAARSKHVSFDLSSTVAEFLRGAFVDQRAGERADHRTAGEGASGSRPSEKSAPDTMMLPPISPQPVAELPANASSRIPTWKRVL